MKSLSELQRDLNNRLELVVEDVTEKIYEDLIRVIKKSIYSVPESQYYDRTGDFLNAFKKESIKQELNVITKNIVYDWMSMSKPTPGINQGYSHGNFESHIDRRKDLWWILSNITDNDLESDFGGALGLEKFPNGYIQMFEESFNKKINGWINASLKKYGIRGNIK